MTVGTNKRETLKVILITILLCCLGNTVIALNAHKALTSALIRGLDGQDTEDDRKLFSAIPDEYDIDAEKASGKALQGIINARLDKAFDDRDHESIDNVLRIAKYVQPNRSNTYQMIRVLYKYCETSKNQKQPFDAFKTWYTDYQVDVDDVTLHENSRETIGDDITGRLLLIKDRETMAMNIAELVHERRSKKGIVLRDLFKHHVDDTFETAPWTRVRQWHERHHEDVDTIEYGTKTLGHYITSLALRESQERQDLIYSTFFMKDRSDHVSTFLSLVGLLSHGKITDQGKDFSFSSLEKWFKEHPVDVDLIDYPTTKGKLGDAITEAFVKGEHISGLARLVQEHRSKKNAVVCRLLECLQVNSNPALVTKLESWLALYPIDGSKVQYTAFQTVADRIAEIRNPALTALFKRTQDKQKSKSDQTWSTRQKIGFIGGLLLTAGACWYYFVHSKHKNDKKTDDRQAINLKLIE